jgi:hypothetical protein
MKQDLPLNSNNKRDKALILALIICGVAAVKPAATMVIYSSAFAWTVSNDQRRTSEVSASMSHSSSSATGKGVESQLEKKDITYLPDQLHPLLHPPQRLFE